MSNGSSRKKTLIVVFVVFLAGIAFAGLFNVGLAYTNRMEFCTDCHTMSGVFNTFECIFCHAHGEGEMGREHEGEDGYAWDSDRCYSCHPRGVADDD